MNTNTIKSKKVVSGVNDLATKCPRVSSMWSDKNTCSPREVSVYSSKKVVFVCPDCKQEFKAPICNVVKSMMRSNTSCPVCAGRQVVPGINDLATKCPKVVSLWSDKNDYTPSEISARSKKRAIFVCPDCQKQFVTNIRAMTSATASRKVSCLDCSGRRTTSNGFSKPIDAVLVMQDGSKATCTAYHGANNITVEFEDGFVLYHARWNQFVRGTLHHGQKTVEK